MATLAPTYLHSSSGVVSRRTRKLTLTALVSLLGLGVLLAFLMPLAYMGVTAFKTKAQISDVNFHVLPSSAVVFVYEGEEYPLLMVPTETGLRQLALYDPGREQSDFLDPANPAAAPMTWIGRWRQLEPVYELDPTLDNFPNAWSAINLGRLFRNTFVIAIAGTIGTLLSSIAVAYGFSRFRIPGINLIFLVLISTIILPRQVTLIPTYIFFRTIGWGGTWWPLIIPHFFANAYNVFWLRQFFRSIPRELDEAATIDGASPLQTLLYVIVPQSLPAITAVAVFHFFFAWNDFFEPLVYLQGKESLYTISIGLTQFTNIFGVEPGMAMAAALMTVAVPVVIFFFAQRAFMQGIVVTGVEK